MSGPDVKTCFIQSWFYIFLFMYLVLSIIIYNINTFTSLIATTT